MYDRTPITPIPRNEISCDILTADQINTRINHCAIIHEEDQDLGDIGTLDAPNPNQTEMLLFGIKRAGKILLQIAYQDWTWRINDYCQGMVVMCIYCKFVL